MFQANVGQAKGMIDLQYTVNVKSESIEMPQTISSQRAYQSNDPLTYYHPSHVKQRPVFDKIPCVKQNALLHDAKYKCDRCAKEFGSADVSNFVTTDSIKELTGLLEKDTRKIIITMIHKFRDAQPNMNERDNVIVMVDGSYNDINDTGVIKMKQAISGGVTLIAMKRAATWAGNNGLANIQQKKLIAEKPKKHHRHAYCDLAANNGAQYIGGAIFETKLDLSHPLAFGHKNELLPVFRRGTLFFEVSKNAYASPLIYTKNPLLSGYISKKNLKALSNSASIVVSSVSKGKVICMADNPNFRGYWYGTNRLFANALFFGDLISGRATERVK